LIHGLTGFVYREFFSLLLPEYARLGVEGAEELQKEIEADAKTTRRPRLG